MNIEFFRKLKWFVLLILIQVFVLNSIHLFGLATPLLYVYFVIQFRRNYPHWGLMLWAFIMGLFVDMLSNTPGISTFSLTLISAIQPFALNSFISHENLEDLKPGMGTLSLGKYTSFVLLITFVYCIVFFSLEMFSFFNWLEWATSILSSTLLTTVLILVIENARRL